MSGRQAWRCGQAFLFLAGLSWGTCYQLQAQTVTPNQSGSASSFGLGYLPQTNLMGSPLGQPGMALLPIPMYTGTAGQKTSATGAVNPMMMDPLGLGYVYGPAAVPMTQGQAGLFMLSTATRSLGVGTGQLSGVRPAGPGKNAHASNTPVLAAHTRNSNIPGGQAARYFNRGTAAAPSSRSQPYYKRQLHQFPQTGQ